jgi:phosphoglycolate phosphatase-like HAD superfamily hydrolase
MLDAARSMRDVTIISDLDDTLVPFKKLYVNYADALTQGLAKASGVAADQITAGFNALYRNDGIFQFEDAIQRHPALGKAFPDTDLRKKFAPEIKAAQQQMATHGKAAEQTIAALHAAKKAGARLVLYTAAPAAFTIDKVRNAGLSGVFDHIYAVADQRHATDAAARAGHPSADWDVMHTVPRYPKDSPDVLQAILRDLYPKGDAAGKAVMLGDHPVQDVLMAQKAGIEGVLVTGLRHGESPANSQQVLGAVLAKKGAIAARRAAQEKIKVTPDMVVATAGDAVQAIQKDMRARQVYRFAGNIARQDNVTGAGR